LGGGRFEVVVDGDFRFGGFGDGDFLMGRFLAGFLGGGGSKSESLSVWETSLAEEQDELLRLS